MTDNSKIIDAYRQVIEQPIDEASDPTGIKVHHKSKDGKDKETIVFTANDAKRFHRQVKSQGGQITGHTLMHGTKPGKYRAYKEDVDLEAIEEQLAPATPMREALLQMWSEASRDDHIKGATAPEDVNDRYSERTKQMFKDHEPKVVVDPQKGVDDVAAAGRATSITTSRHNNK